MDEAWTSGLAAALAGTLRELSSTVGAQPVLRIAIDCHPWHGSLHLSVLSKQAADDDPLLLEPEEMDGWDHSDCARELPTWTQACERLGAQLQAAYQQAEDPSTAARIALRDCAAACDDQRVQEALSSWQLATDFRFTVTHPDDDEELYPPTRRKNAE